MKGLALVMKLSWQEIGANYNYVGKKFLEMGVFPFSLLKSVRNSCKYPVLLAMPRSLTLEITDIVNTPFFLSKQFRKRKK